MSNILPFPRKNNWEDQLRDKALDLMVQMSAEDLHTLQNDVLARDPSIRKLPAILEEDFREWLNEYGGIDREDMMAPEREGETWAQFAEEFIDLHENVEGYEQKVSIAKSHLNGQWLRPVSAIDEQETVEATSPNSERPTPP